MKKNFKRIISAVIALIMLFSVSVVAYATQGQNTDVATVSDSLSFLQSNKSDSQASDTLTVTSSLSLNAAASDPTGIIKVTVSNCSGKSYSIDWTYQTGSSRVVDPPVVANKSSTSSSITWELSVTAVQVGSTSIPFTVTNKTAGTTVGTKYCNITVTAPTLTVTPSDIVIDLNNSNTTTIKAVVSNFFSIDTINIGFGTSSSKINCEYGNYISNGTELIVSSSTAGTYYLYVGLRNPNTGYDILTQTYKVTVKAKTQVVLSSISVYSPPNKTVYEVGETFNSSGLKIKACYSDGSTQIISSGFTCSSPDMSTAGTKKVNVSYGGKITSFSITVNKAVTLSSISVYSAPSKTVYEVGETFDSSGLKIKACYSDGSSQIISSGFTCSSPDMSTAGTKTITVSYGGKMTTLKITVNEATSETVNATSVDIILVSDFGDTNVAQLSAMVNPSYASFSSIRWTSSDTSIATVDSDGTVTTYDVAGQAIITVTVTNCDGTTVSDSVTVTVSESGSGADNDSEKSIWDMILSFFALLIDFLLLPIMIFI